MKVNDIVKVSEKYPQSKYNIGNIKGEKGRITQILSNLNFPFIYWVLFEDYNYDPQKGCALSEEGLLHID